MTGGLLPAGMSKSRLPNPLAGIHGPTITAKAGNSMNITLQIKCGHLGVVTVEKFLVVCSAGREAAFASRLVEDSSVSWIT